MRILAIGDPHGDLEKIKEIPLKGIDLILLTGDLGKADLARKRFFGNVERKKNGLPKKEPTGEDFEREYMEVYESSIEVLKYLSGFTPVYLVFGNVEQSDAETRKDMKKYNANVPLFVQSVKTLENVFIINNKLKRVNRIRVGGLNYFLDNSWIKEFDEKDKKKIREAKIGTKKAEKILDKFDNDLHILLCHQPPYGILDEVGAPAPMHWRGKHAGSKVVLDYIQKHQPRYVFCGHIHEGEGKARIGKTEIYNLGVAGHKIIEL